MPTVSMFFGVIIRMYWQDHMPPHFHAYYQNDSALFDLEGKSVRGLASQKADQPCSGLVCDPSR